MLTSFMAEFAMLNFLLNILLSSEANQWKIIIWGPRVPWLSSLPDIMCTIMDQKEKNKTSRRLKKRDLTWLGWSLAWLSVY